jgi:chaperonin GroES
VLVCYNGGRKGVKINMALKPLKDRIVAVVEKPLEKTASGILLGEAKEKPAYAVVESVGPEVKGVKKGDKIVYKEYSTTDIKMDGKDYIILKEEDVLATM